MSAECRGSRNETGAVWSEVKFGIPFQIDGRHDRGGVREFVYDADKPAFLKTELVGFGVDRHW